MTEKEFFAKARESEWRVGSLFGWVRCAKGYCPLGAVVGDGYALPVPSKAAKTLGIAPHLARKIANAADSPRSKYRPWLLKQLGVRGTP